MRRERKMKMSPVMWACMIIFGIIAVGTVTMMVVFVDHPLVNTDVVSDDVKKVSVNTKNTIVIYPTFTEIAYNPHGFYDYYKQKCDTSCLTISYRLPNYDYHSASMSGYEALKALNYTIVGDLTVDAHPEILKHYDTVIILHNEYVTQTEFDAITSHQHVIYLYPNALYAMVKYNSTSNSFTLIRGHGYPEAATASESSGISNGFGWKDDDSQFETDKDCASWKFVPASNGKMLNCYPESIILSDKKLIGELNFDN